MQKPGAGSLITSPGVKLYPQGFPFTPVAGTGVGLGAGGCVGTGVGVGGTGVGVGLGVGDGVGVGVGLVGFVFVNCTFTAGELAWLDCVGVSAD
ncbi:hypothetical protein KSD_50130 [Ktedonobacter sp. SOSP1-85]|nr:hypothetical protein KSD_50130 [Ktedonobacter sp. SOSP1-85]